VKTMRILGTFSLLLGILAALGEWFGMAFPTARWFFNTSRDTPFLHFGGNEGFPWFGWLSCILLTAAGIWFILRSFRRGPLNPITQRRIKRFREIKRGYWSLIILCVLIGLASLDQLLVGKRAIAVKYNDQWVFPALLPRELKNKDFGITDESAEAPADYRRLQREFRANGRGWVMMPPVPYDPTGDTVVLRSKTMVLEGGQYREKGKGQPYVGLAGRFHDVHEGKLHLRYTLREGRISGPVDGWNREGMPVYSANYENGVKVSESYNGEGDLEDFLKLTPEDLRALKYNPAPPIWEEKHWLGTNSQGYDVLAYLYGGLQVNFKAAAIFIPIVYLIGVTVGLLMGYFGSWFDLLFQRLIEIFSNIPFLFVVIILSSSVPDHIKGLPVILTILILFGWMGMTYLMRTAAYRDKERDYIAAARVLGAGTPRILLRHLLPNTVAIIVTLIPFTISSLIFSLTSLDYLGFGLPPRYATWGRLLNDGLANLFAPWLVTYTFTMLVFLLVLITFVGEAVREAFDPKKFTYYR